MSSGWSPYLSSSSSDPEENDRWLERELDSLERAVREHGPLDRRALARIVASRYWGPGRFGRAVRAGVLQGRLVRVRRGVYGPPG